LKLFFFKILDRFFGFHLVYNLKKLDEVVNLSENELDDLQRHKMVRVLNNARNYSTFFVDKIPKEINEENVFDIIREIPILEKKDLRDNINQIVTLPIQRLVQNASSGSTGLRTEVYWTKKEQKINRATQILWWHWAGYRWGMPIIQTGITPNRGVVKRIKDILLSTYYVQAFSHSREDTLRLNRWAQKQKKGVFLAGYASSLFSLGKIGEEMGWTRIKTAVSWGDKLFDHYRSKIKETFNCDVFETYGSAEGLMIAAQKDLKYMYIMTPNVFLEIVDDFGNPVKDGVLGHVIVTNLNGYGTPLIRYRIGDLAIKLPKDQYPGDRKLQLPLLQKVIGRDTDIIKTPKGKILVVHSFTGFFEHRREIAQFQVIQNELES